VSFCSTSGPERKEHDSGDSQDVAESPQGYAEEAKDREEPVRVGTFGGAAIGVEGDGELTVWSVGCPHEQNSLH
jgi:hypothetical protein